MISREKKEKTIEDLVEILKTNNSIIFTDFSGLSAPEINELKKDLREKGIIYKVTKKSLWPFVFKKIESEDVSAISEYKGSVGIAYNNDEGVLGAKAVDDFKSRYKEFGVLGGFLGRVFVGPEKILELAKLPGREELLSKFVYVINSPRQNLVGALGANINNLVSVINQIRENK